MNALRTIALAILIAFGSAAIGQTISPSGGGGTPGGSTSQVQYNNSGAFGGSTKFSWDDTAPGTLSVGVISGAFLNPGGNVHAAQFRTLDGSHVQTEVTDAFYANSAGRVYWTNGPNANSGFDLSIGRNAAGVLEVTNVSANAYREILTRSYIVGGTVPGISGCSAGTQAGGGTAGTFVIGATSCSVVLTFAFTSPTGWSCYANDRTTAAAAGLVHQTASSTTTATIAVPATAVISDVVDFHCMGY